MLTERIPTTYVERIIHSEKNVWFLGPGGIARLHPGNITADGTLTKTAETYLRNQGLFATPKPEQYSLTVLTSTDCNLGCGYCFQNTGQDPTGGNRPPRITHARLTSQTITQILEFTKTHMAASQQDKLHILLFGGEPLLNPRGCKELLARAADYGLTSAAMISNGTLLTPPLAQQLADLGLRAVQVTFDGDHPQHDLIRIRRSGGGTFEAIINNMAAVSQTTPLGWHLRINVSHHNHHGIHTLIDRLTDRLDPTRCSIQFAWVDDVGVGYTNNLQHETTLAHQFFNWRRHATENGLKVKQPTAQTPCPTCSYTNGQYGAVINADGTLSSCWETAGKPDWHVGDITNGYLPAEQTTDRWISCEDSCRYTTDDQTIRTFHDTIDAAFLDYLHETGRLQP
jgi:uncharacterized protein